MPTLTELFGAITNYESEDDFVYNLTTANHPDQIVQVNFLTGDVSIFIKGQVGGPVTLKLEMTVIQPPPPLTLTTVEFYSSNGLTKLNTLQLKIALPSSKPYIYNMDGRRWLLDNDALSTPRFRLIPLDSDRIKFGKHNGMCYLEVPSNYLRFLYNTGIEDTLDPDKLEAATYILGNFSTLAFKT